MLVCEVLCVVPVHVSTRPTTIGLWLLACVKAAHHLTPAECERDLSEEVETWL